MHSEKLWRLADKVANEYISREDTVAVAVTGSLAKQTTWEGSDVDLWVFSKREDGFQEGMDNGIYWEADIKHTSVLEIPFDLQRWLTPPKLKENDGNLYDALWQCKIVYDPTGKLAQYKARIDETMADDDWLEARRKNYLLYGRGCLDALKFANPLHAIVIARDIATMYGIASYWMGQKQLLSSLRRVPENLSAAPHIQTLYKSIYNLKGRQGAEEYWHHLDRLPAAVKQKIQTDLDYEIRPVYQLGYYDGSVCKLLQLLAKQFDPEEVRPWLCIDSDPESHKRRILQEVQELITLCSSS
ncbi:nucleotidyltransferase domain-containing protein [Paenibacillus sp. MZ04-78.2]|uniref:nucleotidyltransferase domain-containing protein n=1 Tax=Paenibacillus sp. MZ04-78.2 TaxID=2962034 RepID=UPI0020B892E0|nr:nucleotidyltransferase domain-containing protein [Paenibacillus sp. MZ04-78.2]MCP3774488.1 nucleotidyltransferase domain-containing protein [Paenibacillus sp. MZ04-78.2]